MKNIIVSLLALFIFNLSLAGEDISYFRNAFNEIKDLKTAKAFLGTEIEDNNLTNAATIYAYKAVCTMMIAQYVNNPFTKLSWFNKGKAMLNQSISSYKGVESTYLRLIVQLNAPFFLGYNNEIKSDTEYIKKNIEGENIPDSVKKYILKNLIETGKVDSLKQLGKKYESK